MRFLRSWIFTLLLVVLACVILWVRIVPRPRAKHMRAIPDLSQTSPLNQPGGAPEPEEAYAIYSALYQEAPAQEPLAFANYSSTDVPQVDGSCLKPATADERAMADAFTAANRQSHAWEQRFTIASGYRLLNPQQVNQGLECLEARGHDIPQCAPYKDLRHIRFLGAPGFDAGQTHALVSIIRKCGRYCGSGGIFEVEKVGGTWRRAEAGTFTEGCSWMFER